MTRRPPILPLGTPDRPQQPPRIVPAGVDPDLRARLWPAIVAAACLIWGAIAAAAWSLWL
jgi:hypothetical protein